MSRMTSFLLSASMVIGSAPMLHAETDIAALTCGQFLKRDPAGRDALSHDLLLWAECTENCTIAGSLIALLYGMDDRQVLQYIEARCAGQPDDTNVVERLKEDL